MFLGTGATMTFSSGFLAEILDIKINGEVGRWDASHMGTTNAKDLRPLNLKEWTIDVEMAHAHEKTPPVGNTPEAITIVAASAGAGATSDWAFTGFMESYQATIPLEDRQVATCRLVCKSNPTVTP